MPPQQRRLLFVFTLEFTYTLRMVLYASIAALLIMLASLSGIIFTSRRLGSWMERNLPFLATFSIGIFAVVTWELFGEALEEGTLATIIASVIVGMVLVKVLSLLIPDAHHHHDPHPDHSHSHLDARRILMGDAIHNIGDGLLLVPAFLIDAQLGIATAAGIFLHELVQEISEYFILKEAGYSTRDALVRNFATSATILIGVFLGTNLASIEWLKIPLMGISAGGFLFIILRDLVPHTVKSIREKGRGDKHVQAIVFGILIMLGVNAVLPHSHEEQSDKAFDATNILR
jgi:zinc and cadmium transporter